MNRLVLIVTLAAHERGFYTVLTSGCEGKHEEHSDHYKGCAEDFDFIHIEQSRPATDEEGRALRSEIFQLVTPDYYLRWHGANGHLHGAWRPRFGVNRGD